MLVGRRGSNYSAPPLPKALNKVHKNLLQKIERETGIHYSNWNGTDAKISDFYGKCVKIVELVKYSKYFKIHLVYKGKSFSVKSNSRKLYMTLKDCKFPLNFKLISYAGTKKNRI